MFKDRAFNLSILFSTALHLFWIFAVCIIVTPSVQPSDAYQEVAFLGPILEKTAFDLMVEEIKPQAETLYARSTLFLDKIYLKPKGPDRKVLKGSIPSAVLNRLAFFLQDYVKGPKEIPLYFAEDIRMVYAETEKKDMSPLMEGPAKEREIIFKPERLTISRGAYAGGEKYIVKLKFFISDRGIVYDVEPLVASGHPEIDLEAIRFLKKWRFSPLSLVEKNKSTWGIVTVKVETK